MPRIPAIANKLAIAGCLQRGLDANTSKAFLHSEKAMLKEETTHMRHQIENIGSMAAIAHKKVEKFMKAHFEVSSYI